MIEVRQTDDFRRWLSNLRDTRAKAVIARRIQRIAGGAFGDSRSVGEMVSELRIDFGPGYRAYYTRVGQTVVFILCGGDKGSQTRDIEKAKTLAKKVHQ